jgi:AraC family transcriptional regulator of adaptative response/methylated-DNA-[protein]-cysteine methyltransferase
MSRLQFSVTVTALGPFAVIGGGGRVVMATFLNPAPVGRELTAAAARQAAYALEADEVAGLMEAEALSAYIATGSPEDITGLRPDPLLWTTSFHTNLWTAISHIPHGQTITYGALGKRLDNPRGPRPVANACGANPIAVLVPCHRVVAAGKIGGYAWGEGRKRHLLAREKIAATQRGVA